MPDWCSSTLDGTELVEVNPLFGGLARLTRELRRVNGRLRTATLVL
jgi:hypothetical protein